MEAQSGLSFCRFVFRLDKSFWKKKTFMNEEKQWFSVAMGNFNDDFHKVFN